MKKHIVTPIAICLFVVVATLTCCKPPAPPALTEADIQHLRDVTANVQDSWNRKDREPYVNRFSADAIYMAPNMECLTGKDAIRSFITSYPDVKVKLSLIEIAGSAEYAFARGAYHITTATDSLLDKGKFLTVWKKSPDASWLATHDMFNSDLPVPVVKEVVVAK